MYSRNFFGVSSKRMSFKKCGVHSTRLCPEVARPAAGPGSRLRLRAEPQLPPSKSSHTESVLPRSRSCVRRARKIPPSSHPPGENRGWMPWLSQSMYLNMRTPHELQSSCLGKCAGGLCSSSHSLTSSRACTAAGRSDFFVWGAVTVQSRFQILPPSLQSSFQVLPPSLLFC